jgi:hypothetical protein
MTVEEAQENFERQCREARKETPPFGLSHDSWETVIYYSSGLFCHSCNEHRPCDCDRRKEREELKGLRELQGLHFENSRRLLLLALLGGAE